MTGEQCIVSHCIPAGPCVDPEGAQHVFTAVRSTVRSISSSMLAELGPLVRPKYALHETQRSTGGSSKCHHRWSQKRKKQKKKKKKADRNDAKRRGCLSGWRTPHLDNGNLQLKTASFSGRARDGNATLRNTRAGRGATAVSKKMFILLLLY